jgi:hypothetical protein
MASKARAKYKAKNIHAYKRIFECSHPQCDDHGIVTYREEPADSDDQVPVTIRRCIIHTNWQPTKEPPQVKEAKNKYVKMTDYRKFLSIDNYNAGLGR